MENRVQVFGFEGNEVRVVVRDGEPWWVAKDVAEALGYVWNGTARIFHVPEEWRGVTSVVTPWGEQEMAVLSEQGLYFFLGRSDKLLALPFQKWLAGSVVPSIRKHGMYAKDELLNNPDLLLEVVTQLRDERNARLALEAQREAERPLVAFAESVLTSSESILVRELAKVASKNGIEIGQNRLYKRLRDWGLVMADSTEPYQRAIDAGWFEVAERSVDTPFGPILRFTTKVTPKGQVYIVGRLRDEQNKTA
jgi:anti-repressor protein